MSTNTSDLWTASEQPIFNAWESLTPVDDFFKHEPRYEQWYRDLHAQDEAYRHFMLLLAALNRHQHDPAPPKCLTGEVALIYTPTPSPLAEGQHARALGHFAEMRAAVDHVKNRRRAKTI